MAKRETFRIYSITDARLVQLADGVADCVERDLAELAMYGITQATVDDLRAARNAFDDIAPDNYFNAQVSATTEKKNLLADELRLVTRGIMTRVENKFTAMSDEYLRFGTASLSRMNDLELHHCSLRVHKKATELLNELVSEGLTIAILDDLLQKATGFDATLANHFDAKRNRDIATTERISRGNTLYRFVVKLTNTGKDYWATRNEAKYNDYLLSG